MNTHTTLKAQDLHAYNTSQLEALLAYLNLPKVGALADASGPISTDVNDGMEIETPLRQVLKNRRDKVGGFQTPQDLIDLEGFGPEALGDMVARISTLGRYGNRARPVWGGPAGEQAFFALLEGATRYIHITTYIIGGEAGLRLAKLLAQKQAEGVDVRLMFCATGFVISGSPSGTGFVSRLSEMRSYLFNDMYVRKKILKVLREAKVPFVNNAPIGRHWTRRNLRKQGIKNADDYYRWSRERGLPDEWLDQQARIDAVCGPTFANVDHRKMAIVDGDRAFVGSQNLADSYFYSNTLSDDPKVNVRAWQWQDNSTILEGPCVHTLTRLFGERWMLCGGDIFDPNDKHYSPPPERVGDAVVTLERSIPGSIRMPLKKNLSRFFSTMLGAYRRPHIEGNHPIRDRMLQLPKITQNELYVEHCYPSDVDLLDYWAEAGKDLSNFTMVVPLHYDTKVLGMECDRSYPNLIENGIRVFGYNRAIMHSKIAVVDGWYTATGSYNITVRSARADLENEFLIQCPKNGAAVRDHIKKDMVDSRLVVPGAMAKYRTKHSLPIFDAVVRFFLL